MSDINTHIDFKAFEANNKAVTARIKKDLKKRNNLTSDGSFWTRIPELDRHLMIAASAFSTVQKGRPKLITAALLHTHGAEMERINKAGFMLKSITPASVAGRLKDFKNKYGIEAPYIAPYKVPYRPEAVSSTNDGKVVQLFKVA